MVTRKSTYLQETLYKEQKMEHLEIHVPASLEIHSRVIATIIKL